jgi:hypothetical protein
LTKADIAAYLENLGVSQSAASILSDLVIPESGANPDTVYTNSTTGEHSVGLLQINIGQGGNLSTVEGLSGVKGIAANTTWLQNIQNNLQAATAVFKQQGLAAWSTLSQWATYQNQDYNVGGSNDTVSAANSGSNAGTSTPSSAVTGLFKWYDPASWGASAYNSTHTTTGTATTPGAAGFDAVTGANSAVTGNQGIVANAEAWLTAQLPKVAVKVGMFILAICLLILGFVLLFKDEIGQGVQTIAGIASKVAE